MSFLVGNRLEVLNVLGGIGFHAEYQFSFADKRYKLFNDATLRHNLQYHRIGVGINYSFGARK